MNRYATLHNIVLELQPNHVVEIGTWNGDRAADFMGTSNCYYTGFDLFEEASQETDEKEYNVKKHFEVAEVAQALNRKGFTKYMLVRGDTNETLANTTVEPFDFCFIDGGHSEDTIKNDFTWVYENIEPGGTIILDDYYTPYFPGMGCNFLKDEYGAEELEPRDRIVDRSVSLLKITK